MQTISNNTNLFYVDNLNSKYSGLFVFLDSFNQWFKIFDDINVFDGDNKLNVIENITGIKKSNQIKKICKNDNDTIEIIFSTKDNKTLLIETLTHRCQRYYRLKFFFDIRPIFSKPIFNRNLSIRYINDYNYVVEYSDNITKKNIVVLIKSSSSLNLNRKNTWEKFEYAYDKLRKDDYEFWLNNLFNIFIHDKQKILIKIFDTDEQNELDKIIKNSSLIYKLSNILAIIDRDKVSLTTRRDLSRLKIINFKKNIFFNDLFLLNDGYLAAVDSLVELTNFKKSIIYAGMPWFMQNWSRDELVSLKAFFLFDYNNKFYDFSYSLLNKYLNLLKEYHFIPRVISDDLKKNDISKDSYGYLIMRLKEFLVRYRIAQTYLSKEFNLRTILSLFEKYYLKEDDSGFITADKHDQWMDTIKRKYPIELQAQQLTYYYFMYGYTYSTKYKQKYDLLKKRIHRYFVKDNMLLDSLDSDEIRPNIFLAYYNHNKMFSYDDWLKYVVLAIKHLWLDWRINYKNKVINAGGIATVSKYSPNFTKQYTGINTASYHNGDSWFFINNIAAMVLVDIYNHYSYQKEITKLNQEFRDAKLKPINYYITSIINASLYDILYFYSKGNASELSSANNFTPSAAFNQAWSNATFIELVKRLLS